MLSPFIASILLLGILVSPFACTETEIGGNYAKVTSRHEDMIHRLEETVVHLQKLVSKNEKLYGEQIQFLTRKNEDMDRRLRRYEKDLLDLTMRCDAKLGKSSLKAQKEDKRTMVPSNNIKAPENAVIELPTQNGSVNASYQEPGGLRATNEGKVFHTRQISGTYTV